MSHSQELDLAVVVAPRPERSHVSPRPQVVKNGPGMHLNILFSAGVAFKGILMLTMRYVSLRRLFLVGLSSARLPRPSQAAICELWRSGSEGADEEWTVFLAYAAYRISASNDITRAIEDVGPPDFGSLREVFV
ncbi:hypothetical protein HWV62_17186 [Athelia sp. TMB]|nr:hypothetical protein HWV62_17186 [Athelia sp. TMB]